MTNIDSASVIRRREGALPQPPSPQGTLAVLSGNQRRSRDIGIRAKLPAYVTAVAFIREHKRVTREQLRQAFGWSKGTVHGAIDRAIINGLIARIGKGPGCHGASFYAPVIVPGWPL